MKITLSELRARLVSLEHPSLAGFWPIVVTRLPGSASSAYTGHGVNIYLDDESGQMRPASTLATIDRLIRIHGTGAQVGAVWRALTRGARWQRWPVLDWTGYASGVFPRACPPEVARELWAALAQPPREASLHEYLTWWAVPEMRQPLRASPNMI